MMMNPRIEAATANMSQNDILNQGMIVAQRLATEGTAQIQGNLIKGERAAINAYIATLLDPYMGNLLLVSVPGGGKTQLLSHGFKIINGIEAQSVASVPPRTDLTPAELTGKVQEIVTTEDGKTTRTRGVVVPIISPKAQLITADEVNRGNQRTVGALNNVVSGRVIETENGEEYMSELEGVAFGMNPTESLQTTSRHHG
jgi:MoxR-like ATPase